MSYWDAVSQMTWEEWINHDLTQPCPRGTKRCISPHPRGAGACLNFGAPGHLVSELTAHVKLLEVPADTAA